MKQLFTLLTLSAMFCLVACGSSGKSSGTPATPGPSSSSSSSGGLDARSASYEFFTSVSREAFSLSALDPENPTATPISIISGPVSVSVLGSVFAYDSYTIKKAEQTLSGMHRYAIVYAKKDGKLYKVNALKTSSLTPVQISSETHADTFCESEVESWYLGGQDQSLIFYSLPGDDKDCDQADDNVWNMVRLDMGVNVPPIRAKKRILKLVDLAGSALSGWLVNDSGWVKRCDANFENCGVALAPVAKYAGKLLSLSADVTLLQIDQDLYLYNQATDQLSTSRFTLAADSSVEVIVDDSNAYLASGKSIYRMPIDGSAAAVSIFTSNETIGDVRNLINMSNKILFAITDSVPGHQRIVSLDKTSLLTTVLAANPDADWVLSFESAGKVFYSFSSSTYSEAKGSKHISLVSGVMNEDGSDKAEQASSEWVGFVLPITFSPKLGGFFSLSLEGVIQLQADSALDLGDAGGTLWKVDVLTGRRVINLGTLPTTRGFALERFPSNFGTESSVLIQASVTTIISPSSESITQHDLFFLDVNKANSLVRITDTDEVDEAVVY